jgi:hypothetical protein
MPKFQVTLGGAPPYPRCILLLGNAWMDPANEAHNVEKVGSFLWPDKSWWCKKMWEVGGASCGEIVNDGVNAITQEFWNIREMANPVVLSSLGYSTLWIQARFVLTSDVTQLFESFWTCDTSIHVQEQQLDDDNNNDDYLLCVNHWGHVMCWLEIYIWISPHPQQQLWNGSQRDNMFGTIRIWSNLNSRWFHLFGRTWELDRNESGWHTSAWWSCCCTRRDHYAWALKQVFWSSVP